MKVVTIGTSKITSKMIEQMRMVGIEVFACVSRDLDRAKAFAFHNNVEHYADNYDRVLSSDEFDFVYVAVPNMYHYEYARKALMAGKNVIVEKPFALNQRQTSELMSLALTKHLYIYENMRIYHSLAFKSLKNDIARLGKIKMVKMSYAKKSEAYEKFMSNEPQTKLGLDVGSCALNDLNCYNISLCCALFGLPLSSTYLCNFEKNLDTSGVAILKYPTFMCNLVASKDIDGKNYISIEGENGYIEYDGYPGNMDNYSIHLKNTAARKINYMEQFHFLSTLKDFKNIYENKDMAKYDYYMKLSLMEMKVLDELKKSANIKFKGE